MYSHKKLLGAIVITGLATAFFHFLAINYYLYWTFGWFDIPMHLIGGVFVGFVMSWALLVLHTNNPIQVKQSIAFVMLSVFFVGIGWEVFEAVTKTTGVIPGNDYVSDTMLDLIMDIIGGAFAAEYTFNKIYQYE